MTHPSLRVLLTTGFDKSDLPNSVKKTESM